MTCESEAIWVVDSSANGSTIPFPGFCRDVRDAICQALMLKADLSRPEGIAVSGEERLPDSMAHRRRSNGEDYEESSVTRGLDLLKPYKSASHSWRMDAKA